MLLFQKLSTRTLSHAVAVASVLQCLSIASCCCMKGHTTCSDTRKDIVTGACFSSCDRLPWYRICRFSTDHIHCNTPSTTCGDKQFCCFDCCPYTCHRIFLKHDYKHNKKPNGSPKRSLSGTISHRNHSPASSITENANQVPVRTLDSDRYSLLCRFLF